MFPYLRKVRASYSKCTINRERAAVVPKKHLSFKLRKTASVSMKLGSSLGSNLAGIPLRRLLMPIRMIRISPPWEAICSRVKILGALNMYLPACPSRNIISSLEGEYVYLNVGTKFK
jgi:hypothetical protein